MDSAGVDGGFKSHRKTLFVGLQSFVRQGKGVGLHHDVVVGNAILFCLSVKPQSS
jgi:hypothetical protein